MVRITPRALAWGGGAAVLGALAGFASIVSQDPGGSRGIWIILATLLGGGVVFVTTVAGFAVLTRVDVSLPQRSRPDARPVFISYVTADQRWAEWVRQELEHAGYTVHVYNRDAGFGEHMSQLARTEMARARCVLELVSTALFAWGDFADRREAAVTHPVHGSALLVRVDEAQLRDGLDIDVDLTALNPEQARDALLEALVLHGAAASSTASGPSPSAPYPGSGPEIWNLPPANPNFTGREDLLIRVRRNFVAPGGAQAQVLYGMGGVGKTQLAMEYAHRYRAHYDVVWWIPSDPPGGIQPSLLRLSREMGLPDVASHDEPPLTNLWNELRDRERWLLIFDSAEKFEALEAYWPTSGTGHIMVTSLNSGWLSMVSVCLPVDVLTEEESMEFLRRRSRDDDADSARRLGAELGHLPLALAQAAAYVDETRTTLADYLELFHTHRAELLRLGTPHGYGQTVRTTWSMSIKKADLQAPGARDLLALTAFLASDDIPRAMPAEHPEVLPAALSHVARGPLSYNEAIKALSGYSLVSAEADALDVHQLVQWAVRQGLTSVDQALWAEVAVRLVLSTFPEDARQPGQWPAGDQLLPHALTACAHARDLAAAPVPTATLLHRAALYRHWRGEVRPAYELFKTALSIREGVFGDRHPQVAETLSAIARVCYHLAELKVGMAAVERALAIRVETLGEDHPLVAENHADLGRILRELAKLDSAERHTERAIEIGRSSYAPDDPRLLEFINFRGIIQWRRGRLMAAARTFESILDVQEARQVRFDVATSCKHLGMVYRDLRWYERALEQLERGQEIMAALYGPDHLETIEILVHLADVRRLMGLAQQAREDLERARRIRTRRLGKEHPDLANCLIKLGAVLRQLGELEEAYEIVSHARDVFVRSYGRRHPYAAEALVQMGPTLFGLGRPEEARDTLNDALKIFEGVYGLRHPAVAEAYEYLVPVLRATGAPVMAEEKARGAERIREEAATAL